MLVSPEFHSAHGEKSHIVDTSPDTGDVFEFQVVEPYEIQRILENMARKLAASLHSS